MSEIEYDVIMTCLVSISRWCIEFVQQHLLYHIGQLADLFLGAAAFNYIDLDERHLGQYDVLN